MDVINRYLGYGSLIVIVVTVVLFVLALFVKGATHDLFVEAGVFLVSVKLIIASQRSYLQGRSIERKIDELAARIDRAAGNGPPRQ